MRDDVKVEVELEAEDKLAVRLKRLRVEGPKVEGSTREILERQTRAVLEIESCFDGGLSLLEVDGVSSAVLLRSPKPREGRFVEVILRNGNSIRVEARGGATHLSRENYEKLVKRVTDLLEG